MVDRPRSSVFFSEITDLDRLAAHTTTHLKRCVTVSGGALCMTESARS
jgi:hypothetical protein